MRLNFIIISSFHLENVIESFHRIAYIKKTQIIQYGYPLSKSRNQLFIESSEQIITSRISGVVRL